MFLRIKTDKRGNKYLYREERWREGRKVKSRSTYIGRAGGGSSPGYLVPALPFMMAYYLVSGRRVEQVKQDMAQRGKQSQAARAWGAQKFTDADRQRGYDRIANAPKSPSHQGFNSPAELLAAMSQKESAKEKDAPAAPPASEAPATGAPSASSEAPVADEGTDADGGKDGGG